MYEAVEIEESKLIEKSVKGSYLYASHNSNPHSLVDNGKCSHLRYLDKFPHFGMVDCRMVDHLKY